MTARRDRRWGGTPTRNRPVARQKCKLSATETVTSPSDIETDRHATIGVWLNLHVCTVLESAHGITPATTHAHLRCSLMRTWRISKDKKTTQLEYFFARSPISTSYSACNARRCSGRINIFFRFSFIYAKVFFLYKEILLYRVSRCGRAYMILHQRTEACISKISPRGKSIRPTMMRSRGGLLGLWEPGWRWGGRVCLGVRGARWWGLPRSRRRTRDRDLDRGRGPWSLVVVVVPACVAVIFVEREGCVQAEVQPSAFV